MTVQGACQFWPIHRVNPVEVQAGSGRLVLLEMSDHVPGDSMQRRGSDCIREFDFFVLAFLDVILSEVADPRQNASGDMVQWLTFGDCDDDDVFSTSASAFRCAGDAFFKSLTALLDLLLKRRQCAGDLHALCSHRAASSSRARVSSAGKPMTLVSLPSTDSTKRRPSPWSA